MRPELSKLLHDLRAEVASVQSLEERKELYCLLDELMTELLAPTALGQALARLPPPKPAYSLDEMLARITPENPNRGDMWQATPPVSRESGASMPKRRKPGRLAGRMKDRAPFAQVLQDIPNVGHDEDFERDPDSSRLKAHAEVMLTFANKLKRAIAENPDLPPTFVRDVLKSLQELDKGAVPYRFGPMRQP